MLIINKYSSDYLNNIFAGIILLESLALAFKHSSKILRLIGLCKKNLHDE